MCLLACEALGAVLDCALTLNAADDANGEQEKTLLQLLQLLIQSGEFALVAGYSVVQMA